MKTKPIIGTILCPKLPLSCLHNLLITDEEIDCDVNGASAQVVPQAQETIEPFYENGANMQQDSSRPDNDQTNLIILNTPPSPTPKAGSLATPILGPSQGSNKLAIPQDQVVLRPSRTGFKSDPVSPNVPWHPELDRRHSDSANVSKYAQKSKSSADAKKENRATYQNTNLTSGTKPKVASHDQLMASNSADKSTTRYLFYSWTF